MRLSDLIYDAAWRLREFGDMNVEVCDRNGEFYGKHIDIYVRTNTDGTKEFIVMFTNTGKSEE